MQKRQAGREVNGLSGKRIVRTAVRLSNNPGGKKAILLYDMSRYVRARILQKDAGSNPVTPALNKRR